MTSVRAHWYRGGTSKCWLFSAAEVAEHAATREDLAALLAGAFGADDPRQIDGVGGATSTTSKAAVVGPSTDPDADVEYLFAQVGIGDGTVEFGSNCGNAATAVALHAVRTGLVAVTGDETPVRMLNRNSGTRLLARVATPGGRVAEDGAGTVPGTRATGVPVGLGFLAPTGGSTGRALPTGQAVDELTLPEVGRHSRATIVDAGAPAALFAAADLGFTGTENLDLFTEAVPQLTLWRRAAALRANLALPGDPISHAVPKVGIVGPPADYRSTTGELVRAADVDLVVRMVSMLAPHPAIGLTSAVAVAAAAMVPGSTVHAALAAGRSAEPAAPRTANAAGPQAALADVADHDRCTVRIGTPAGVVTADVLRDTSGQIAEVSLHRAARHIADATIALPALARA